MAGLGRIPWTAVDKYAERMEIRGSYFDGFVSLIEALDSLFLEDQANRSKRSPNSKPDGK